MGHELELLLEFIPRTWKIGAGLMSQHLFGKDKEGNPKPSNIEINQIYL